MILLTVVRITNFSSLQFMSTDTRVRDFLGGETNRQSYIATAKVGKAGKHLAYLKFHHYKIIYIYMTNITIIFIHCNIYSVYRCT